MTLIRAHASRALAWLLVPAALAAQDRPLDRYVNEGLAANLTVRQQALSVDRSEVGVAEARGQLLPSLTFNARYSERSGAIPDIGSLVNPAFGSLNQLLGQPRFPTDVALKLPLKQETSLRLVQPIFQPAAIAGLKVARSLEDGERAALEVTTRQVAAAIRLGYLNYAKALKLRELNDSTLVVLRENLRVNQALLDNGKVTPDAVLRARAEVSAAQQARADADRLADASRLTFNQLLSRPLASPLDLIPDSALGLALTMSVDSALAMAHATREEFQQLRAARGAAEGVRQAARATFLPGVSVAVDYGFQGEQYRFNRRSDFVVASLVVQWNVFNGGRDRARWSAANHELDRLDAARRELEQRVELDVRTAHQAAEVARQAITTARDRLASARRTFELVERRYAQGAAALVEYLDARTTYTSAGLNEILTTYDFYQRCVELERAAGLYPPPPGGHREAP